MNSVLIIKLIQCVQVHPWKGKPDLLTDHLYKAQRGEQAFCRQIQSLGKCKGAPLEQLNIPSWKRPTRIIESNSWLHRAPPKIQTLCLRALSKCFLVLQHSGPCPASSGAEPFPNPRLTYRAASGRPPTWQGTTWLCSYCLVEAMLLKSWSMCKKCRQTGKRLPFCFVNVAWETDFPTPLPIYRMGRAKTGSSQKCLHVRTSFKLRHKKKLKLRCLNQKGLLFLSQRSWLSPQGSHSPHPPGQDKKERSEALAERKEEKDLLDFSDEEQTKCFPCISSVESKASNSSHHPKPVLLQPCPLPRLPLLLLHLTQDPCLQRAQHNRSFPRTQRYKSSSGPPHLIPCSGHAGSSHAGATWRAAPSCPNGTCSSHRAHAGDGTAPQGGTHCRQRGQQHQLQVPKLRAHRQFWKDVWVIHLCSQVYLSIYLFISSGDKMFE